MQFKNVLIAIISLSAYALPFVRATEGDVHRATRIVHAIVKESPFIVEQTTVVTWTEGPAIPTPAVTPVPLTIASAPAAVPLDG